MATSVFWSELRQQAHAYLARNNEHRFGDGMLYWKGISLGAGVVLALLLAVNAERTWHFALAYIGFLFLSMLLAMNLLHDAAHNALFRTIRLNRLLMRIISIPVGIDPDYWTIRHVHYHHAYANIDGYDLDTEANRFLRQTPFQRWHPQFRYQHIYWPLVAALSLLYISWFSDWLDRFGKTPLANEHRLSGSRGWAIFWLSKAAHLMIALVVPIYLLRDAGIDWKEVLSCYIVGQMLASCFLVAMVLGTHWAEVEFFLPAADGVMPHTWCEHAFFTTCDWSPRPQWLGYWLGGLNFHLTHHLFPTYSHRHYKALASIVARLAQKHQLHYRNISYAMLLASQQKFLKSMGQQNTL